MKLKSSFYFGTIIAAMLICLSCESSKNKDFIGSAVVDASTFQIATTSQGMIANILKDEGMPVATDELVAIIDTVPLILKLNELTSSIAQLDQTMAAKKAEIESQDFDVKGAHREYRRISDLVDKGALPSQQKDNLQTQFESISLKMKANRLTLESLQKQEKTLGDQVSEIKDLLKRCYVKAAGTGVVLTRYKNLGEVVQPGNPLFEIGKYDTMQIDFYITQPMLPGFRLGQTVRIRLDDAADKRKEDFLAAHVSWIGEDAEFSPKNIQTRESRNELVFKIRALAPNPDKRLKRGLPVEVWR
jgi:HlyD family secretion protein